MIVSGSWSNGVKFWDVATGAALANQVFRGYCANSIALSHDGQTLATGNNDGKVRIWDTSTLKLQQTLEVSRWSVFVVAISPNGQLVAADGANGTIQLWDIKDGSLLQSVGEQGQRVEAMAFSPDGSLLATVSISGDAAVWDVISGQALSRFHSNEMERSIYFSSDGQVVAIAGSGKIYFWTTHNGDPLQTVKLPDEIDPFKNDDGIMRKSSFARSRLVFVPSIVLSPDLMTAASCLENGDIAIWDLESRQVRAMLTGEHSAIESGGGVMSLFFSHNGNIVATGSQSGKVQLWDLKKVVRRKARLRLPPIQHANAMAQSECAPARHNHVPGIND
jgi:WD40 repeat protein